ncbi:hypothetical protein [Celerinatantimonas diazotrophica]|uniref:Uncharacterized protein n=1 Tax=Celerinatantimonas diazotrophica TaxID=412034 RepID=A0A4R1K232_9GAMM|nr:hypothetical protein [Celerinatantimonas diazotrophica]TCK58065.1 hypothetical protein EV690_1770 [Celerinatantimonas diazotrophica]CAG9297866.1 hypothetical protein CEDIAZO_03058 [Celerinatantimonas diazotrophica]
MLICAKDGWREDWSKAIPSTWNYQTCHKYQSIPIYALSQDNKLLVVRPVLPKLNPVAAIWWWLLNRYRKVDVQFTPVSADATKAFQEILSQSVHCDDTTELDKHWLEQQINDAHSYYDFAKIYQQSGWSMTHH